mgnify:CR=1 FL=1|jgi:hypothetical protein
MNQTISEQLALERLARKHERDLKFLRHSPREQRWIPFVEDSQIPEILEALLGTVIFFALIAALATMPWWLP